MKHALSALGALAALSLVAATLAGDCSLTQIEKAKYCVKCDMLIETAKAAVKLTKEGLHKECAEENKEKPRDIDLCVKKHYVADCHPNKTSDKPGT